jgi:SulP family sulfate permease
VLQPYGSLFFAAAPVVEAMLPVVGENSTRSVVILRLRGRSELGTTFIDVLHRYAVALADVDGQLKLVSVSERLLEQFEVGGVTDVVGPENIYLSSERVSASLNRAHRDAHEWVSRPTSD